MKIQIYLDSGDEKVTNLSLANAVLELCQDASQSNLSPTIIAKAILLEAESEGTE